jgi:ATP-dependent Clp protease ATP-binding subunit ClpX
LVQPKNAITKQYQKLLAMDGIKLIFDDAALDYIVDKAMEFRLGARGLRSLTETIMMDIMFEVPSAKNMDNTFVVTRELAEEKINKADTIRLRNAV